MQLDLSENSLPVYDALSSSVRLQILTLISEHQYNITELAEQLGLSKAIITKHIQKLEEAHLIHCKRIPGKSGLQKIPVLAVDNISIAFPSQIYHSFLTYTSNIRLGHYTDFSVSPTCGLATATGIVGKLDDSRAFVDPNRVNAELLWFSEGFVEYMIPNRLSENQLPELFEISMEIASEFPYSNNVWPSDIYFDINGVRIGTWTCPGNFSDVRGFYTPAWWGDNLSQYGLLKHIRIGRKDTSVDGEYLSAVTVEDLNLRNDNFIRLRIGVDPKARHKGGITLFGSGFGNHAQNINTKLFYS